MDIITELVEYFDFVQKVFGGAIASVFMGGQALFEQVNDLACQAYDKIVDTANAAANGKLNVSAMASVSVSFPVPPLSVPLMSISKQVEDVMKKIMIIKEIIRAKAKLILAKLKSLQGMVLYINVPEDFFLILAVLVEAEFIYSNLPIVLDKILEYFINLFVQKFAEIAAGIIDQLFSIWNKVIEIVPPLDDLLKLAWAIPNTADFCFNIALNIALPEMYGIIQPFIDMPFDALDMISAMCDVATNAAYQIPEP